MSQLSTIIEEMSGLKVTASANYNYDITTQIPLSDVETARVNKILAVETIKALSTRYLFKDLLKRNGGNCCTTLLKVYNTLVSWRLDPNTFTMFVQRDFKESVGLNMHDKRINEAAHALHLSQEPNIESVYDVIVAPMKSGTSMCSFDIATCTIELFIEHGVLPDNWDKVVAVLNN